MATIAHIFRHPIKGVGVEEVSSVTFEAGKTMPWDRVWAIAHEAARLDDGWNPCVNFIRKKRWVINHLNFFATEMSTFARVGV